MNIIQPWFVTLFGLAGVVNRQNQATIEYLVAENRILKEQLKKHGRIRFTDKQRFLLAVRAMELGRKALLKLETIVVCDTLLRWHRQLVANKYDSSASPRKQGRPRIKNELEDLVVRMAKENLRWGYTRVRGAMHELGHALARSTISDILGRNGIVPAPERERTRKWADFLAAHWDVMAATDFFTVEVWSPLGLVRYHVLFVMELCTRKVHIAGIVHNPHGPWMKQVARNLTDEFDGFLTDKKYLISDRDPLFTKEFRKTLRDSGVKMVRLPSRSPNLNAYAERFVLSIKSECLNWLILFSEAQLRRCVNEYIQHYHLERHHQGLENKLIEGRAVANSDAPVQCRRRLGGLLKYYHRGAA